MRKSLIIDRNMFSILVEVRFPPIVIRRRLEGVIFSKIQEEMNMYF